MKSRLAHAQVVFKVAKWHDELLAAKDPVLTLRLAGGLCLLALLSNIFRCLYLPGKACQNYMW